MMHADPWDCGEAPGIGCAPISPPPLVFSPESGWSPKPLREPGLVRLGWWINARYWAARNWLGGKLARLADRVLAIPPLDVSAAPASVPAPPPPEPINPTSASYPQHYSRQWCDIMAALRLGQDISDLYGIELVAVWRTMERIPDECCDLFDTPEGWAIIANWVADQLGVTRIVTLTPPVN